MGRSKKCAPTASLSCATCEVIPRWYCPCFPLPQSFFGAAPGVNYTAIILETIVDKSTGIKHDVSVEYDCGANFLGTNYCIHVLSRKPTLPMSIVNSLFQRAEAMGLNTQSLPANMTK